MEFTRRKVRGRSQKLHKLWVSDCGNYRITWNNEHGFRHYYGLVLTERFDGTTWWNFAVRRGPYKTRTKAAEECERNKKLWDAFIKLSYSDGRRDGRLDTLKARASFVFRSLPVWVRSEAEPSLIKMLLPCKIQNQSDDSEDSTDFESTSLVGDLEASDSSSKTQTSSPASNVVETALLMITNTLVDPTTDQINSPAQPVEEPAAAKSKSSKQRTKKVSKNTETTSRRGKSKNPSAKVASRSSRKKKS